MLEINQSEWLKLYVGINTHTKKKIEVGNNAKALHKLMTKAIYGKEMENLRIRIDVNLVNNKKD